MNRKNPTSKLGAAATWLLVILVALFPFPWWW